MLCVQTARWQFACTFLRCLRFTLFRTSSPRSGSPSGGNAMILSGRNSVLLRADRGFCCAYKPHDGNLRTTRRCTLFTSCRTFAQPCVSCMFVRLAVQHIPQWHEEQLCIQCHHVFVDSKSVRLSSFRRARLDALIGLHIQTFMK